MKTPRVVVRDDAIPDAKTFKSKLYHFYNDPDVKDDLNRKAEPGSPFPTWYRWPITCWAKIGSVLKRTGKVRGIRRRR